MAFPVIFDMDGLMFDMERLRMQAWDYAGQRAGIGPAGYMVLRTLGMSPERSRQEWQQAFGQQYCPERLQAYKKEFYCLWRKEHHVPVMKGLLPLLQMLQAQQRPLAVASSSVEEEVRWNLKDAGVETFFSAVVAGDMVARSKPAPDIYLEACSRLGAEPSVCWALEDSTNGVRAAYSAGCRCILVPDLQPATEETTAMAVAVCRDLSQARTFLANMP